MWVWILGVVVVLAAGMVVGSWLHGVLLPQWYVWRAMPRENRRDRRRRRARAAIAAAEDLLESEYAPHALRSARRACRLDPSNPLALYVLARAWHARNRYELAYECLQRAYRNAENDHYSLLMDGPDFIPELTIFAVRLCISLRKQVYTALEKEVWNEAALNWVAAAFEKDPQGAEVLMEDPLLWDLRTQIHMMVEYKDAKKT